MQTLENLQQLSPCVRTNSNINQVPITISFVPPLVVIKTLLVVLPTVDYTNCTLCALLSLSKCCSYRFVACHLWLAIVTESEPDVPVSRHVDGNDTALVEVGG